MDQLLFSEMFDHGKKKNNPQYCLVFVKDSRNNSEGYIYLFLVFIHGCIEVVYILSQGRASGKAVDQCKKWRYNI